MRSGGQPVRALLTRAYELRRNRSGNIAVEFSLLLPVILLLALAAAEAALAISDQMTVQAAARAGTHFGLAKPPVQGDMQPIIDSVRAAVPSGWIDPKNPNKAVIAASIVCECEFTGAIQCGLACAPSERLQSYLKVDVSKIHTGLVKIRGWSATMKLQNSSLVRIQ